MLFKKIFFVLAMWACPRHRCKICQKNTRRRCTFCPVAYCSSHLDNNIFTDNSGSLVCSQHCDFAVKGNQTVRNTSYVNRNTPIIEYEKPFSGKYRPPPKGSRNERPEEKENEILMEPNLTDNTPILVENPLLSSQIDSSPTLSTSSRLNDGVTVQIVYVDEEGRIVDVDTTTDLNPGKNHSLKIKIYVFLF